MRCKNQRLRGELAQALHIVFRTSGPGHHCKSSLRGTIRLENLCNFVTPHDIHDRKLHLGNVDELLSKPHQLMYRSSDCAAPSRGSALRVSRGCVRHDPEPWPHAAMAPGTRAARAMGGWVARAISGVPDLSF